MPLVLVSIPPIGAKEVLVESYCVKEGSRVRPFSPIAIVRTDSITAEVQCNYDGIVQKVILRPNDIAQCGDPLLALLFDDGIDHLAFEDYRPIGCRWWAVGVYAVEVVKRIWRWYGIKRQLFRTRRRW